MSNRYYGSLSAEDRLLKSIDFEAKKRGFHDIRILTNWKDIVGEENASIISPLKMTYKTNNEIVEKTLYVSTENRGFATTFSFVEQDILDLLNHYFGTEKSKFVKVKIKVI